MLTQWLSSAWRRSFFIGTLFVVALIGFPLKAQAVGATELINLTNIERSNAGLAPLNYNGKLASSAYAKAQDMLAKGYWAHTAPDGTSPWYFVQQVGYSYVTVGENLAKDFPTDSGVVAGWMASPGHRANILNPAFRDIGIGVVSGTFQGSQTTIVVAHYGATSAAAPAPAPKPAPKQAAATQKPVAAQTTTQAPVAQAAAPVVEQPKPVVPTPKPKSTLAVFIENLVKMINPPKEELVRA